MKKSFSPLDGTHFKSGLRLPLIFFLLIVVFSMQSCVTGGMEGGGKHPVKPPRNLTTSEKTLVASANRFSYDIFRHVAASDSKKNVFISPLSISMALGMTLNGAAGTTRAGIQKTLDMGGMTLHEINQSYQSLIELLINLDPKVVINIANSLWSREGFTIHQSFIDTLQTYFKAKAEALDFSNSASSGIINNWVKHQTQGRIKQIISGRIPPDMMLYLINAVYFKGHWLYKFDPDDTKPAPFHLQDGSTIQVDMMHRKAPLAVYYSNEVQMAQLAYGDSLYVMDILMPANPSPPVEISVRSLDHFVQHSLTAANLKRWTDRLKPVYKEIALPTFETSYKKTLNDILKTMGMDEAFDKSRADFSGINSKKQLFISQVLHKANITVNEEGSEAAAVTSVGMTATAVGPNQIFNVNRPFVYVIRERTSGTILFVGVMRNPEK